MKKTMIAALAAATTAFVGFFFVGCEVQSTDTPLDVTPSSAVVRKGQSVTFTVSGGFDYTWSLDSDAYGIVTRPGRNQATYTCLTAPTEVAVVTLTVSSSITTTDRTTGTNGTANAGANTDATTATAEVFITHQP